MNEVLVCNVNDPMSIKKMVMSSKSNSKLMVYIAVV